MIQKSKEVSENKKLFILAVASAIVSVMLSVFGAPFVRVLVTTKSKIFWPLGLVLIPTLFFLKLDLIAVYVGAIWMTLGLYTELELTGLNWKKSSVISVLTGVSFAALTSLIISKWSVDHVLVQQAIQPLSLFFKLTYPDKSVEAKALMAFMPGVMSSLLMLSIACSLAFESHVAQMFNLRRDKLASGLRWLDFKLPDQFVWVSLFSFLFSIIETPYKPVQVIAINLSIISFVAYFFQGIAVSEFALRVFRFGQITKALTYFLILTSVGPLFVAIGFADYWLDLRRVLRKKIKVI